MTSESGGRKFVSQVMGDMSYAHLSPCRIEALQDPGTLNRLYHIREGLERYAPKQALILDAAIAFLEELPMLCINKSPKQPLTIQRSILPSDEWRDGLKQARSTIVSSLPEEFRDKLRNAASTAYLLENPDILSDTDMEKVTLCQQLDWARSWLGNPRFIPQRENAASIQK